MKSLIVLCALMLATGCTLTIAPSVKIQIGGSDARVCVNNEQHGAGNEIEKTTKTDAELSTPTEVKGTVTP